MIGIQHLKENFQEQQLKTSTEIYQILGLDLVMAT